MKKTYVTPEVEYINFYSEELITAEEVSITYSEQDNVEDTDSGFWGN